MIIGGVGYGTGSTGLGGLTGKLLGGFGSGTW